jgi:Integrase core domain
MMKTADFGNLHDRAHLRPLDWPPIRRILLEREVSSRPVRLIGSIRRECLDHVLILNEAHLRRVLRGYIGYYNTARPHQSLDNNSPRPRDVQRPALGGVVAIPQVGGLHHIYQRAA